MDVQRESTYPADAYATFGMLTDEAFLERRAVATQAIRHQVSVTNAPDGTVTARTHRTLPAAMIPDAMRKLVGDTVEVDEVIEWGPAEPDGTRTGELRLDVAKAPVRGRGTIRLDGQGDGTTRQTVTLDIKASVPMLGRKIEEAAAPAVLAALEVEEELGGRWLAQRS